MILLICYIITVLLLLFLIPRHKLREAIVIFFFKQLLTWLIGLIVAQLGLIVYQVRSFPDATNTSFDFEYFFYPSICVLFNLYYPNGKGPIGEFMHYFYYCTVMTILEVVFETYTNIIQYIHWHWTLTWVTLFITFYLSRKFYLWFFKKEWTDQEK